MLEYLKMQNVSGCHMRKIATLIREGIMVVFAQVAAFALQPVLNRRNIWIVSEKKTEARDNGYHFFKYICTQKPELNAYYVIQVGAADEERVRNLGHVIPYDSLRHCIYFFAAKYRVCSQTHGVSPFNEHTGVVRRLRFYRRKNQYQINLKHGISKDFRDAFDFRKLGFDLYICGAEPEYHYIKETFRYPERNIALTGFCRFDALYDLPETEKIILVMPTFREWLRTSDSAKNQASEQEINSFKDSKYYRYYAGFLSDTRLIDIVRDNGYKVVFYLHYTFQPYTGVFDELLTSEQKEYVIIAKRNEFDVQDLLKRAAVLVTDYSSVFFDFSYMYKPVIYCQFDEAEYREKHYQEGYFVYKRDGFGPVVTTADETFVCLRELMERGMRMDDAYRCRVNSFFNPHDAHNCERVYNAILRLDV